MVPWVARMKMSFHAIGRPVFQLMQEVILCGFWLQTEGIPGKINHFPALVKGKIKPFPEMPQRIFCIQFLRKFLAVLKGHARFSEGTKNAKVCGPIMTWHMHAP